MIDSAIKKYFWDTDISKLDLAEHKTYIIERILDIGDDDAVRWLKQFYPKEDILAVALHSKRLSPKSKNFWQLAARHL